MINYNLEKDIVNKIKNNSSAVLPNIIKDIIKSNNADASRMKRLWREYSGEAKILNKATKLGAATNIDNRVPTHIGARAIQQVGGYMYSDKIKVLPDVDIINSFNKRNFSQKLDYELGIITSVCGKGFRLPYIKRNRQTNLTEIAMINIMPWEAIVIEDATIQEPAYGLIYYNVTDEQDKELTRVEFYDSRYVYYFIEENGNFVPDTTYENILEAHQFDFMPLIKTKNNALEKGDFENISDTEFGYDKLISFTLNDIQTISNAILTVNFPLDDDTVNKLNTLRVLKYPNKKNPDDTTIYKAEYLIKDMKVDAIKELADIMYQNIYADLAAVDMYDQNFYSQSGESIKYKLIPLENKCGEKEMYFREGLTRLYNIAASFWSRVKDINIDLDELDFQFTRKLPVDLSSVDKIVALKNAGLISTEDALSQIPFITNVKNALARLEAENQTKNEMTSRLINGLSSISGSSVSQ